MAKTITDATLVLVASATRGQSENVVATVSMPSSEWAAFIAPLSGLTDGMNAATKTKIAADIAALTASRALNSIP